MRLNVADKETLDAVAARLGVRTEKVIHAFHIRDAESNPASKVTYLGSTVGMAPASMNFSTGTFDYGSWGGAFFMPRPVMLRTDCTVAYELKQDDYTKKKDGTDSDVANPDFDGNAMMEWGNNGHIWWKMEPDANDPYSGSFYVANYKPDMSFHDWNYHKHGNRFYTAIYPGSLIDGKLRSLSGQTTMRNQTAEQERTYAKANGEHYDILQWVDWVLVACLSILISKTCDSQTAFGMGQCNETGGESTILQTGTMDTRGLMWGENTGIGNGAKLFGMENWFGSQWKRCVGLASDHGIPKVKMTRDTRDGSTADNYNLTGTGYIEIPNGMTEGTSGGYISRMLYTPYGVLPKTVSGSSSTQYTDGSWFEKNQTDFSWVGGALDIGNKNGIFCTHMFYNYAYSNYFVNTSLSCKPPATAE